MQQQQITPKFCPNYQLYNVLQDMRQCLLIDIRIDNEIHIRSSFQIKKQGILKQFIQCTNENIQKAEEFEKKYNSKKIRRAFFYDSSDITPEIESQNQLQDYLQVLKKIDPEFRLYYLKGGFTEFYAKYPYLCVSHEELQKYNVMTQLPQDQQVERKHLLTDVQKKVLFSQCQFPIEFYENQVYMGNIYHANSDKFLESLKIKTIIDFTDEKSDLQQKRIKNELKTKYNYQEIPLIKNKEGIAYDFDQVNEFISEKIENNDGPILLFCKDGFGISPCFAISWLMYQKKMNFQIASLQIFQYLGGKMDVCKFMYSQLMNYVPKN